MKATGIPKRLTFSINDKPRPSYLINSVSTIQGNIKITPPVLEGPNSIRKHSPISVLLEEVKKMKSGVSQLLDDAHSGKNMGSNDPEKVQNNPAYKSSNRKDGALPASTKCGGGKPAYPLNRPFQNSNESSGLKQLFQNAQFNTRTNKEEESRIKQQNNDLHKEIKVLRKNNERLQQRVVEVQKQLLQSDVEIKKQQSEFIKMMKQYQGAEEKLEMIKEERNELYNQMEIFEKKEKKNLGVIAELHREVGCKEEQIQRMRKEVAQLREGQRSEKKQSYVTRSGLVEKKMSRSQTEEGMQEEMRQEIQYLRGTIKVQDRAVQSLVVDIRRFEGDLKAANATFWENGELKKLIHDLNEELVAKQAQTANIKMKNRYCIF